MILDPILMSSNRDIKTPAAASCERALGWKRDLCSEAAMTASSASGIVKEARWVMCDFFEPLGDLFGKCPQAEQLYLTVLVSSASITIQHMDGNPTVGILGVNDVNTGPPLIIISRADKM